MLTFIIPLLLGLIIGFLIRGKPSESFLISGKKRAAWSIGIGFIGLVIGLPIGLATSQSTGPQIAGLIGGGLGLGVLNVLSLENSTYQKWSDRHSFVWLIVGFTCAIAFSAYRLFDIKLSMPSQQSTESEMRSLSLSELQTKAESGDPAAQIELGSRYEWGIKGVVENGVEAVKWYRRAAELGNAEAQWRLGTRFEFGQGVYKNYAEAMKWYQLSANQGNTAAQWSVGKLYESGAGVPENDVEAVRWYRLAAERGNFVAQHSLGFMYKDGKGVPQSAADAAMWFRRAADQGNERSQVELALLYLNGEGVPKSYTEAYFWWNLAAVQGGSFDRDARDRLERQMTREQIAEAQRRSAAWKPKKE